jgi:hypothetical protein
LAVGWSNTTFLLQTAYTLFSGILPLRAIIDVRSYAVALFCITQRVPEDALFACGSMVRIDHFVCSFPRAARKTAHN